MWVQVAKYVDIDSFVQRRQSMHHELVVKNIALHVPLLSLTFQVFCFCFGFGMERHLLIFIERSYSLAKNNHRSLFWNIHSSFTYNLQLPSLTLISFAGIVQCLLFVSSLILDHLVGFTICYVS